MNSDELQRVKFDQAKRLNILGFNWPTDSGYGSDGSLLGCASCTSVGFCGRCLAPLGFIFPAPTVALALKWMRDVKGIYCGIGSVFQHYTFYASCCKNIGVGYKKYDEAESDLLDAILYKLEKGSAE